MSSLLADRGAVVVGGSRGIGAAVATLLAQHGAGVVVNGRDGNAARATADAITTAGGRAVAHPGSPSDQPAAESLVDRCIDEFGAIHILVNCAGIAEPSGSSILDISPAQFYELLESHLGTVFATCRAAASKMVEQDGGSIVNTSSSAFLGDYGGTGYPAGKGAVNSLTLAIAAELKEHGVRANVICPGFVRTPLVDKQIPEQAKELGISEDDVVKHVMLKDTVDGEFTTPADVADAVLYFASSPANALTGQSLVVSHGWFMQ